MQSPTLKEKTAKGLYWGSLTSGIQQLISAGFGILLARILTQADYGTIGVLSIFLAVANTLQEGGFTAGLINRKEIKIADYNAVFWFSFGVGASIYLILFFCAPLIAWFFHDPIYIPLSRVMFLWIVAGSLGIAPNAMMQKTLRIKERSIINVTALAVSSITGVVLVLLGYGYWGLVIQSVTQPVVNTTLLWCVSTWRPRWSFDFQSIKEMFSFSSLLVVTGFINQINTNILNVFFGRFYTKEQVGDYGQGNKWAMLCAYFLNTNIQGVAQPVLVEAHSDPERQKKIFRKLLRFIAFFSFPLMFGLALIAPEMIVILITDKWLASIPIMQLFCIWGAFLPVNTLYTQLVFAHGKSNVYLWNTLLLCITQILTLLIIRSAGIVPMVFVFLVINFLWLGVWQYWGQRLIGVRLTEIIRDMLPYLAIVAVTFGISYVISLYIDNLYLRCVEKIAVAGGLYILTVWRLNSVIFKESIDYLFKKKLTVGS